MKIKTHKTKYTITLILAIVLTVLVTSGAMVGLVAGATMGFNENNIAYANWFKNLEKPVSILPEAPSTPELGGKLFDLMPTQDLFLSEYAPISSFSGTDDFNNHSYCIAIFDKNNTSFIETCKSSIDVQSLNDSTKVKYKIYFEYNTPYSTDLKLLIKNNLTNEIDILTFCGWRDIEWTKTLPQSDVIYSEYEASSFAPAYTIAKYINSKYINNLGQFAFEGFKDTVIRFFIKELNTARHDLNPPEYNTGYHLRFTSDFTTYLSNKLEK